MNWIKSLTLCAVMLTAATLWGDDALNQFNTAKTAFDGQQYESARISFDSFLTRFPTHAQANAATFYLAESLMYLRQYAQAETYFNRLVALGLTDSFSRAALFRLAEIPYLQQQFEVAKPRLEDFVTRLKYDANLQFVLYYLGDIAMRSNASNAAEEAEWYFDQAINLFPDGEKVLDSKLGLAWAKNKRGKVTEANEIYAQLMSSSNPAVVEQATYQWGVALFERGAFEEAINVLTDFQRRYPASPYFADTSRVIARCWGRLYEYDEGLQILTQLAQRTNLTTDDQLMRVRFLYGLKRMDEAKTILDEAKRTAGTLYRDEIALLESVFLFDQRDWRSTIARLEQVLAPQFDALNNRMIVHYFSLPLAPGMKRLSEEAIMRACSLLTLSYARNGESAKATALLHEMQGQAALSGNLRLTTITSETSNQLATIGTVTPGRGGSFASRNDQQWTPDAQNASSRPQTVQTSGTELERFRNAERLYRIRNFAAAAEQLEQILSGVYNQSVTPSRYIILYNITGTVGTMDDTTFARACTQLALAKAQLGDFEQADAVLVTLGSRIRMGDTVQQDLLRDAYTQLADLAKGGNGTKTASTSGSQGSMLSESEQRRLLREANNAFLQKRYNDADTRLTELIAGNPSETILVEALLVQSKTKDRLGWERDSVALLERIVDEFPSSPQYPEALWWLGIYHESGGDSFIALEYFKILADQFQNFKHIDGALYFLAVDDLMNGNGRKAATNLGWVYRNRPNGLYWSHATWMLAHEAYKKKEYVQAERYIQEILRHPPDIAILDRVLYLQGTLALRREDYSTAFLAFKEVIQCTPDSPLSRHAIDNAKIAAGRTAGLH